MDPIEIKDTIIFFVRDTVSQSDMINAYQELLHSQQSTNNHLIIVFGILFTLLMGGIVYFNYIRTKGQILEQTKEIFSEERDKIIKQVREKFQNDFAILKSENENKIIELEADMRYIYSSIGSN